MKLKTVLAEILDNDVWYHGSNKNINGNPKKNQPKQSKGSMSNDRISGFYLTKNKWDAQQYSKGGYLYYVEIIGGDILDCTNFQRNDLLKSNTSKPMSFESDFLAYCYERFNNERSSRGKPEITEFDFNERYSKEFISNSGEWNDEGMAYNYLREYIKGFDAVEFETEMVVLNPKILKIVSKEKI